MFNQTAYYANITRQTKAIAKLTQDAPRCETCDKHILTEDEARDIFNLVGRWPREYCNGFQYMQLDPYSNELYGDEELYLMCDGQAYQAAQDI